MLCITQGNHYCLMAPVPGLRNIEVCLMCLSVGAHGGAEMCKLVGTYMLNLLSKKYNKNDFALYCDVGLAVFEIKRGPQSEQVKKNILKIFKEHELDIIIQSNMKIVDYSDVTF